jgi:hypothetical protein
LFKESEVDASKLDAKIGYIQPISIEPLIRKQDGSARLTKFDRAHYVDTFYYDTPFTRDGDKKQGGLDRQWMRRTILEVAETMPSLLRRVLVTGTSVIEYSPIRVSYRQIRDRVVELRGAIDQNDFRGIQRILHGSLLVMVNEGPAKIAEVFLTGETDDKYTTKLKTAFKDFL